MTARVAATARVLACAACAGTLVFSGHAQARLVSVVEFHHAGFNHFFLTTVPAEMAKLDAGLIAGWKRAWTEFKVHDAPAPGLAPVCRFFSAAFAPKSSHFFTAFPDECEALKASPSWTFEGIAFYVRLPDDAGNCEAGTMPIFRGYNGGAGGAPAHRFTPYRADRCAAFGGDLGGACVAEGLGRDGVAFCAPASFDVAHQRTQALGGAQWEFTSAAVPDTTLVLGFGDAEYAYPPFPPVGKPHLPYAAPVIPAFPGGVGGWDPVAGKITVLIPGFWMLQFDFEGVAPGAGCQFEDGDGLLALRGPCEPVTVERR